MRKCLSSFCITQTASILTASILTASILAAATPEPTPSVDQLRSAFHGRYGVELVFDKAELPEGIYHDLMPSLDQTRRQEALQIAWREAAKLPRDFWQKLELKTIGIFESCASREGDGFRQFDKELKGYRYYGIYNGRDALAAAYYSDTQLPLTLHHELFHHIDSIVNLGSRNDRRLSDAVTGKNRYPAPHVSAADLALLKQRSSGSVLEDAVSDYCKKNPAEDKAETARYLMSALPDSLVQICEQPQLAGSQRILHVLDIYRRALNEKGPAIDWFVDVALERQRGAAPDLIAFVKKSPARSLAADLRAIRFDRGEVDERAVRKLLYTAQRLALQKLDAIEAVELAYAAATVTAQLLKTEIRPAGNDRQFYVPGHEDADGVNWVLRECVQNFGRDAALLGALTVPTGPACDTIRRTQLENLRLLARFYVYIAGNWQVTDTTRQVFDAAREQFLLALAKSDPLLAEQLDQHDLARLADQITTTGDVRALENPFSGKINAEIKTPALRAVISHVQPACVRLGNGSGVNIAAGGQILTAAHVAGRLNNKLSAEFPDGRQFTARCTAIDSEHDLAICTIDSQERLPHARIAAAAPAAQDRVVCIGQPGTKTPEGEATDYQPFHVSVGKIRGFVGDPLGNQTLGRTKHDAWTYWGHSGSPLFDEQGHVVALHNSWDSTTAMRHAVTWQAIAQFVRQQKLSAAIVDSSQ